MIIIWPNIIFLTFKMAEDRHIVLCLRVLCCDQFVLDTVELIWLIERHGLSPHLYADDTQVYGSCPPATVDARSSQVTECVDAIVTWTKLNRLQLNPDKTEVLWRATSCANINFHPLSAAELFWLSPHRSGTHYQKQSLLRQCCGRSSTNWNFYFISTIFYLLAL